MDLGLEGKVAVITGAGSGIGRGIAIAFAQEGMNVVVADVVEKDGAKTVEQLQLDSTGIKNPGEHCFIMCDVTSERSVSDLFNEVQRQYGRLDVVVNNAGISPKESYRIDQLPMDVYDKVIAVNQRGYVLVTKYGAQFFIEQASASGGTYPDGSFIFLLSNAGILGSKGNTPYSVSKAAGFGIMRSVARDMADFRVRANGIIPGNILHGSQIWDDDYKKQRAAAKGITVEEVERLYVERAPLKIECTPQHVALVALMLASQKLSGNTTGAVYRTDGGELML